MLKSKLGMWNLTNNSGLLTREQGLKCIPTSHSMCYTLDTVTVENLHMCYFKTIKKKKIVRSGSDCG